jgi:hypothetical protein
MGRKGGPETHKSFNALTWVIISVLVAINVTLLARYMMQDDPGHDILDEIIVKVQNYTKAQKKLFDRQVNTMVISEDMMYTNRGMVSLDSLQKLDKVFVGEIKTTFDQLKAHMDIPGNRRSTKNANILESELWKNLKYLSDTYKDKALIHMEHTNQIRDLLRLIRSKVEYLDVSVDEQEH